jgi:3,4-dihydroxy 2-butanone 4-phosphate synthase
MFTGIVEELGRIESFENGRVRVAATTVLEDVSLGDSIAVNGCCLTVVEHGDGWWEADVSDETVRRTSLAIGAVGDPVNLERAVRVQDRLGGHLVQGHVDAVGEIVEPVPDLRVRVPGRLLRYLVEKGSVTVDGVSLTVVQPLDDGFTVAIIPHTAEVTTLGTRRTGDLVNIEVDVDREVRRAAAPHLHQPSSTDPGAHRMTTESGTPPRSRAATEDVTQFDPIDDAIAAIGRGEIVVVADDEDRENEGDLIMAADLVTEERLAFFVRHTSGVICVGLTGERCDDLDLPLMVPPAGNTESMGTAFTVTVDVADGTTTGISAADRTRTLRALADPTIGSAAFNRPGHIFPLRARPGGTLKRAGHTEAAVDLARLAGRSPAGVLCEVVVDSGAMARVPDLRTFADEHGLLLVSIADLIRYRRRTEKLVRRSASARVPTEWGEFRCYSFESTLDPGDTHLAFVKGDVAGRPTCSSGCTASASPATCSAASSATAVSSSTKRCARSMPREPAWWCTCGVTRAAASASRTSSAPTSCRTPAPTRSTRTSSSACRSTAGSTASARRSSPISASAPSAC